MKPYDDCIYCSGQIEERLEQIDYRYHGQLLILERVPTGVCVQCGERYFKAEVAKRMEFVDSQAGHDVQTVAIPVLSVS
jgi:YgiT-type zinc finger domain-containing protein